MSHKISSLLSCRFGVTVSILRFKWHSCGVNIHAWLIQITSLFEVKVARCLSLLLDVAARSFLACFYAYSEPLVCRYGVFGTDESEVLRWNWRTTLTWVGCVASSRFRFIRCGDSSTACLCPIFANIAIRQSIIGNSAIRLSSWGGGQSICNCLAHSQHQTGIVCQTGLFILGVAGWHP